VHDRGDRATCAAAHAAIAVLPGHVARFCRKRASQCRWGSPLSARVGYGSAAFCRLPRAHTCGHVCGYVGVWVKNAPGTTGYSLLRHILTNSHTPIQVLNAASDSAPTLAYPGTIPALVLSQPPRLWSYQCAENAVDTRCRISHSAPRIPPPHPSSRIPHPASAGPFLQFRRSDGVSSSFAR